MKRMLWITMAAATSAVAASLAVRVLDAAWRRVSHEDPPEMPKWGRFLVGLPIKRGIASHVHASTV